MNRIDESGHRCFLLTSGYDPILPSKKRLKGATNAWIHRFASKELKTAWATFGFGAGKSVG